MKRKPQSEGAALARAHARDDLDASEHDLARSNEATPVASEEVLLLALELAFSRGDLLVAARRRGISTRRARKLQAEHPNLFAAVRRRLSESDDGEGEPTWAELLPEARKTIREVMRYAEPQARLSAAEAVVNRAEGRVPQKVEMHHQEDTPLLDSPFWRFVISLAMHEGIAWAEAERRAHADPEAVQSWARAKGLLPAGGEVAANVEVRGVGGGG